MSASHKIISLSSTSRVLFISDLHAPYHHKSAIPFLSALHKKYTFTNIIGLGDELDNHALSFHDHNPDLDSAGQELQKGREILWELCKVFPKIDWVHSNHGSLAYRKALHHGIPRHLILDYRDAIFGQNKGGGWNWYPELTLALPNGQKIKAFHSRKSNMLMNVKEAGASCVQGHFHSSFGIVFHHTSDFLNFGVSSGCLIDDDAMTFSYNRLETARPVIGTSGLIDGVPRLFPMILDNQRRWTGKVP